MNRRLRIACSPQARGLWRTASVQTLFPAGAGMNRLAGLFPAGAGMNRTLTLALEARG